MLDAFMQALAFSGRPEAIAFVAGGCIIGLIVGALPGLGGVIALSILVPFTFGMESWDAMFLLAGTMGAVPFGGSTSAILINTPGTASNAATCFDGFPMTQQGRGREALAISATASALGAIFGLIVLIALLPVLRIAVMAIGPPEMFAIIIFGLVAVTFAARGNMVRGLATAGFGVLLSLIGFSGMFSTLRYTGGTEYLWDGLQLVPLLVGLFAISELIRFSIKGEIVKSTIIKAKGSMVEGIMQIFRNKLCFLRSSAVGTIVGIIPGVGGPVANFVAYVLAKQWSRHPETFGTGNPEGVIAPESANNAKDGGALVPTVGFGIPGSGEMVVLLGAFTLHGLNPGPLFVRDHLDIVFVLILALLFSNIIASSFGLAVSGYLSRVSFLNVAYLAPAILILCSVGTFAMRTNIWDVVVLLLAGVFGYGMRKFGFPVVCLIIGFILGALAEHAFSQSLMMSSGSYAIFVTRPITLIMLIIVVFILAYPISKSLFARRR